MKMKIKLLENVPVDPKHETFKGRIFEVLKIQAGRYGGVWINGATGEKILIRKHEYTIIKEEDNGTLG